MNSTNSIRLTSHRAILGRPHNQKSGAQQLRCSSIGANGNQKVHILNIWTKYSTFTFAIVDIHGFDACWRCYEKTYTYVEIQFLLTVRQHHLVENPSLHTCRLGILLIDENIIYIITWLDLYGEISIEWCGTWNPSNHSAISCTTRSLISITPSWFFFFHFWFYSYEVAVKWKSGAIE